MRKPPTGLSGLADCYNSSLKFNQGNTFWMTGGGGGCCGFPAQGGCALPILNPDQGHGGEHERQQPRGGVRPGCEFWMEPDGVYYQFGDPNNHSGSGAAYRLPGGGGGGGGGGSAPEILFGDKSGAQLWVHKNATPRYLELKHTDGTVARFEEYMPWAPGTPHYHQIGDPAYVGGTAWRIVQLNDPYDNIAYYTYNTQHQLTQVTFPSGISEHWNYHPGWEWGWNEGYSCIEISYKKGGTLTLSELTWGMVFESPEYAGSPANVRRYTAARLYRTYSSQRRILLEQIGANAGQPWSISGSSTVLGQTVREFTYSESPTTVMVETQRIHIGTLFERELTEHADLPPREILRTQYLSNRVHHQIWGQTQIETLYDYPAATRTNDLLPGTELVATLITDESDGTRRLEYDKTTGRLYREVRTAFSDIHGRPRAAHANTENQGIGGPAASDVEPDSITIDRVYDATCVCKKPIEIRVIATRGGTASTRITRFEYFPDSKLLKKRTVTNPATNPQTPEISWEYTYTQATMAVPPPTTPSWGAWLPLTEVTPDGTWTYEYSDWQDRTNLTEHGRIPGRMTRKIAGVRIQSSLDGSPVAAAATVDETIYRNLPNSPGGLGFQGPVRGGPRRVVDGDGIATTFHYDVSGNVVQIEEAGGQTRTEFVVDVQGRTTQITHNAAAGALASVTTITGQSPFGLVYGMSTTGGSVSEIAEFYHDRWGNLSVVRRNNLASNGAKPSKHNGSTASARDWVESQYHYQHWVLMEEYHDRKPLDEAAGGTGAAAQFLRTEYDYFPDGRLQRVTLPNGTIQEPLFDAYGSYYRTAIFKPGSTVPEYSPKTFVNAFLEPTAVHQESNAGHLWTLVTRNTAGAVTQIVEPQTTAPGGYTGSTGGARHEFDLDTLGRVVQARSYGGVGQTTVLARREVRYDQLDRQIWQSDSVLGFGSGARRAAWRYQDGKASQLHSVEQTGVGPRLYTYWSGSGFLKQVQDTFAAGNRVAYDYHGNTPFVQKVTRTDADGTGSATKTYETFYDVDGHGRTIRVREGVGTQLEHEYFFNSLGLVDRYLDPMDRQQKFLPDALGRLVEHVRIGDGSDFIRNKTVFEDAGLPDAVTRVLRYDGRDNATITHYDFAGRPFILQNPGGDVAPSANNPYRPFCLFAEYDRGSRLVALYDGDEGKTAYWRDGGGRLIQRELQHRSVNIATFNTKDVLKRDALGRLVEAGMWGASSAPGGIPVNDMAVGVEQFDQDSIGRTHAERYLFAFAPGNIVSAQGSFSGGNPFRDELQYQDGLTGGAAGFSAPMRLGFSHDAIGRFSQLRWNTTGGTANDVVANYTWVGGLRRSREVFYQASGLPKWTTAYDYDQYGRLTLIEDQEVPTSGAASLLSRFEYEYDLASNLKKEKYAKAGGWVGDRFTYDAYHRLQQSFLGVSATVMQQSADPTTYDSAQMQAKLTYGLDVANNRDSVVTQSGTSSTTANYAVQDGSHAQGPSNRYATIGPVTAPVVIEHDNRGNLSYDGKFFYRYDYLNRLQEVWVVKATDTAGATAPATSNEKFAVLDEEALEESRQAVHDEVVNLMQRVPREHQDASFRGRLKARIRGGVLRMNVGGGGGGGGMPPRMLLDADLELYAIYAYDAFNRRTMRVVIGVDTLFHTYDGWREVEEFRISLVGQSWVVLPNRQFVWGSRLDELVSYRRKDWGTSTWETYFVHHGGQDTAAKLVDSAGNLVEQYEYDAYGKVTVYDANWALVGTGLASGKGLPFLWKSIRLDNETGLLYMRNRYYSTEGGRFLTPDPLGVWSDASNSGNDLCYCRCDPLGAWDPLGLQGEWHHRLPQAFRDRFAEAGIVVDDAEFGRWMQRSDHTALHAGGRYNKEWENFFDQMSDAKKKPTKDAILQKLEAIEKKFAAELKNAKCVKLSYGAYLKMRAEIREKLMKGRLKGVAQRIDKAVAKAVVRKSAPIPVLGWFLAGIVVCLDVYEHGLLEGVARNLPVASTAYEVADMVELAGIVNDAVESEVNAGMLSGGG
ncbi:MAG: hypothetical protein IPK26_08505 [Planctomycetes bacterium]|nr:hypothetical protein [Planctomycetota bacterium]